MDTIYTVLTAGVIVLQVLLLVFVLDIVAEDEYLDEVNRSVDRI